MKATFIIMGNPITINCFPNQMAWVCRMEALIQSENTGRPPSDFEIRDCYGHYVNPLTKMEDIPAGVIWLSPQIGCGGSHTNYRRKNYPPIMNALHNPKRNCKRILGRCGARHNWHSHARILTAWKRLKARWERLERKAAVREELGQQDLTNPSD